MLRHCSVCFWWQRFIRSSLSFFLFRSAWPTIFFYVCIALILMKMAKLPEAHDKIKLIKLCIIFLPHLVYHNTHCLTISRSLIAFENNARQSFTKFPFFFGSHSEWKRGKRFHCLTFFTVILVKTHFMSLSFWIANGYPFISNSDLFG